MHDTHDEPPTGQTEMTTTAPNGTASCRVRSPYPAPSPGGGGGNRRGGAGVGRPRGADRDRGYRVIAERAAPVCVASPSA